MDLEARKFGRGPRELGGAIDLINHYKLWPYHDFFCKKSLPLSISETQYLHNVVGETEMKKGEGMELDQLFKNTSSHVGNRNAHILPFDLDVLREAFQMKETTPIDLPYGEKGKSNEMRRQKKHRNRDKEKDKDCKKHKHRHKETSRAKDKERIGNGFHEFGPDYLQKQQHKKRRFGGSEDLSGIKRYQQSGVTSVKVDQSTVIYLYVFS
ncbi:hypothetical protein LguiB_004714 [Lonicera macranthoides]